MRKKILARLSTLISFHFFHPTLLAMVGYDVKCCYMQTQATHLLADCLFTCPTNSMFEALSRMFFWRSFMRCDDLQ